MALTPQDEELLARVAKEASLPLALLRDLARLEDEIPDLNLHGAKAELSRRVTDVLNAHIESEGAA